MRTTMMASTFVLALVSSIATAAPKKSESNTSDNDRRCAYLGYCGGFTLIGSNGTAAYKLGDKRYIADLALEFEDDNWWVYHPTANGDRSTKAWAFARHPRGGKYTVMRFSN